MPYGNVSERLILTHCEKYIQRKVAVSILQYYT